MRKMFGVLLVICMMISVAEAASLEPFSHKLNVQVRDYQEQTWTPVPLITWGADIVTIYANGGQRKTAPNSTFGELGLQLEIFREDDFQKQVERFLNGEIAYLRGTMGMINMAADVCNRNPATQLVVVYQHSWSAGGDALVVKGGINRVSDLKGKTIAIQKYGPHVDYMTKLLTDAGLSVSDVNLIWTNDLVGPMGDTPMAKLYGQNVDAAFVIIPDALALTSSGRVGTGAEDSVKGARILLSTKTASRIISDVYAVRKDYFDSHRDDVKKFVKGLLLAEEAVSDLFKDKSSTAFQRMMSGAAKILLDSEQAVGDAEGLYYDAELTGYQGNVQFFANPNYPRNFSNLTNEIQASFQQLGLLSQETELLKAGWDYTELKSGLKYADVEQASRFKKDEVTTIITKRQKQETLGEGELFTFEIYFQPNQNTFSVDLYGEQFRKVVELASTYGGAVITIEGHSDPMGYLRKKKEGQSQVVLKRIIQAAKNLSLSRANRVRDEIINFAAKQGITLDPAQFATVGHGISKPKYPVPQTKQQWLDNMRVEFKVVQVEAEADVFIPLD